MYELRDMLRGLTIGASAEIAGDAGPIGKVLITASMTAALINSGYELVLGLCIGLAIALVLRGVARRIYISGRPSLADS